ncbi:MAG: protein kinase [Bacteroidota bacterium]
MIGSTISHYKVLEKLGEGGMGVVYKAQDTKLDRLVALKFLPIHIDPTDAERSRFLQEARSAAGLNHPNICTIYGIEEVDGQQYIEMELVEGVTLRRKIQRAPLKLGDATSYAIQIAEALQEAHGKGIVHRDVKADNVMVTSRGLIKVMDFGLAKLKGSLRLTRTSSTAGTMAYMAPEQIQGDEVDARSDIFAWGVLFFEMLTGRLPFRGEHEPALMYSILNEEPQALLTLRNDVPDYLTTVIAKALQKTPDARYQSMGALLAELTSPAKAPDHGDLPHTFEFAGRRVKSMQTLMTALVVLVTFTAVYGGLHLAGVFSNLPDERQLVVLPFTTVGADSTKQPFCDGLTETMTSKLTQMEQFHGSFWVVPASEVRRNRTASPSEARLSYGANLVITGNLQLLGEVFRLTLNLIDAGNLRQLSSSVLDVNASSLTSLQEHSVVRVLEMLELQLNPESRRLIQEGQTVVPGAYEFYLQGIGYLQQYVDEEKLDAAITVLAHAITEDSTYALATAGLAEAYWRKYEAAKEPRWAQRAIEMAQKAYGLNTELPQVHATLGMIHTGTGQIDKAVEDFRNALKRDPSNASAHSGLAKAFEAKGMMDQAEHIYRQVILLKPNYWGGYNDLGVFYSRRSRYEDAISQFQEVVKLIPDNDRGFSNLGGIYYLLKRWPEARQMFERAYTLKKTYRVCSNLGTLYYIEGDYPGAARMYERALELNDNDYRVWGNLAAAYFWAKGERDKSGDSYRRAIALAERQRELNKKDPGVMSHLAGYYAMVGGKAKALSLLRHEAIMESRDAEVMYRVGAAYEQMKNRDQALRWIGRAVRSGYAVAEIQHQPELRDLVADARFQRLIAEHESKPKPKK